MQAIENTLISLENEYESILDRIAEIEIDLEDPTITGIKRIRMERSFNDYNNKLVELEIRIEQTNQILEQQKEIERQRREELNRQLYPLTKFYNLAQDVANKIRYSNTDMTILLVSSLYNEFNNIKDIIFSMEYQDKISDIMIQIVNNLSDNQRTKFDMMSNPKHRNVDAKIKEMMDFLGIDFGIEWEMDTSQDEELARQIQKTFI